MERNRQKLVGRDKGSLTEQQTKGTVTTTIQMRRKHNTNRTAQRDALPDRTAVACSRATRELLPLSPTGAQHDDTWHGIPCSLWPGGVSQPSCAPSWIPVKINPVLDEPRTPFQWGCFALALPDLGANGSELVLSNGCSCSVEEASGQAFAFWRAVLSNHMVQLLKVCRPLLQ